ncbi:BPSL0761 family protein [Pseudomonas aeruginosa]
MAVALVQHQGRGLSFELGGKRTSLLAHQTPLSRRGFSPKSVSGISRPLQRLARSQDMSCGSMPSGEVTMTMPNERSRAVVLTRDFLVALSRDNALPEKVRHDAKFLLRHYPTRDDVILAGKIEEQAESMPLEALGPVFSSSLT